MCTTLLCVTLSTVISFPGSVQFINPHSVNDLFYSFSELVAELPFTLMHPKPDETERPSSSSGSHKSESSTKENGETGKGEKESAAASSSSTSQATTNVLVDTNLIQLDT